jgi:hypothetical protein
MSDTPSSRPAAVGSANHVATDQPVYVLDGPGDGVEPVLEQGAAL